MHHFRSYSDSGLQRHPRQECGIKLRKPRGPSQPALSIYRVDLAGLLFNFPSMHKLPVIMGKTKAYALILYMLILTGDRKVITAY